MQKVFIGTQSQIGAATYLHIHTYMSTHTYTYIHISVDIRVHQIHCKKEFEEEPINDILIL